MNGKQMAGILAHWRRRTLGRHVREAGRRPRHDWPKVNPSPVAEPAGEAPAIQYREFVSDVADRTGLDFRAARGGAEAAVTVLARSVPAAARQRLLGALPVELYDDFPVDAQPCPGDLGSFLDQVGLLAGRPPEQARYLVQAVLSAVAERDPDLIEAVDPPAYLRELIAPSPDSCGHTPPLTSTELHAALARLPRWAGSRRALYRSIALPPENLDRVLERLDRLKREVGRGPHIGRQNGAAVLILRTNGVDAVTALDVDLAHRVDAAIDEAGAGTAS